MDCRTTGSLLFSYYDDAELAFDACAVCTEELIYCVVKRKGQQHLLVRWVRSLVLRIRQESDRFAESGL